MKVLASMTKRTPAGFSNERISIKPEGHKKLKMTFNRPKGMPKGLIKASFKMNVPKI